MNNALTMCGCTMADLLRHAETGALTIYVMADQWKAKRVKEIDLTVEVGSASPTISFRGPPLPDIPAPDDPDFEEKCRERIRLEQAQDILCGNVIEYGRFGSFRTMYETIFTGLQPVAARAFCEYQTHPDSAEIILDLNRVLSLSHHDHERLVYPDPLTLVRDALQNDSLMLMLDDIQWLLEKSPG
jgi:hypothetical protein